MQPKVTWFLRSYRKQDDCLVEEYPLKAVNVATLQRLFDQTPDNPMYDAYAVSEAQAEHLRPYVDHPLRLQSYDYFVECAAEEAAPMAA